MEPTDYIPEAQALFEAALDRELDAIEVDLAKAEVDTPKTDEK